MSQKRFPKWRQVFLKKWLPIYAKKLEILCISYRTILFNFHKHMVQILIK